MIVQHHDIRIEIMVLHFHFVISLVKSIYFVPG